MQLHFPRQWNVFSHGKPGHRFQDRYRAQRRNRAEQGIFRRLRRLVLALGAAAIGVVLVFIPGPAIVFFFLAGALLASDWRWMARTLDWLEVKLRAWWKVGHKKWQQLPAAGRVAVLLAGGGLTAATTYGAYRLMQ